MNATEDYYYVSINEATSSALGLYEGSDLVTISVQASAQATLAYIDSAIANKDNIRANLGAMQNRLENYHKQPDHSGGKPCRQQNHKYLMWMWPTEMTEFVRNQVMAQAGVAMLAQANALPQMALNTTWCLKNWGE
ncbi:hypothetical protein BLFGPEAP_00829 [Candidatus Methanoperedenaceae archaeon GB50]|nr:hypothetical protein BLFGPEAP_00829 [Candidatus Methanoperedenaceae archaeon GB50]